MELCIAAGVGLMLAHMGSGEQRRSNRRQKLVAALKFMMSGKMLVRLMLVIMVITLVLTRSRMGNAAFFSSLMIVGGLAMLSNPRLRKGAFWLVLSLIVVDVIIVGQWVGIDHVVERLQNTSVRTEHARGEESLEQRAQTPYLALGMVRERPVAGFGAGSFYTVFPRFKSADKEAYWDYAHNDYVQIAAETGLVGLGLLAGVVLMTIGRIMLLWRAHESRFHRGLAFGSAMAICALLIHSWVDFNLQMPANALVFCVLLAVMWALVPRPPRSSTATQVSPDPA
jgi:O-antigen ligase